MRNDGQQGQALIEALFASTAIAVLFAAVVLVGKLHAIRTAAITGSALLAFTCVAVPDRCTDAAATAAVAARVRNRLFSAWSPGAQAPIVPAASVVPPLWTDLRGAAMVDLPAGVDHAVAAQPLDAPAGLLGAASGATTAVLAAGPARFGLDLRSGLLAADIVVRVDAAHLAMPFARADVPAPLQIRARTVALADDWNASGAQVGDDHDTASRVDAGRRLPDWLESLHETGYAPVRAFVATVGGLGLEPAASSFAWHVADPGILPPDRERR